MQYNSEKRIEAAKLIEAMDLTELKRAELFDELLKIKEENINLEMYHDKIKTPPPETPQPPKTRNFLDNIKSFNSFLKMEAKEVPCIIKGMIVEKAINAITARTAEGKSIFMLRMLKDIAAGTSFLNMYPTKKQRILLFDMEMNENFLVDRIKTILQDETDGDVFYESDLNIERDYENLRDLISGQGQYEENGPYGLVVFDTLSLIHSRDENSNPEMTHVLKCMLRLINDTGCTILFLHHHGKNKEHYGSHLSRGATTIIDKASSHLTIHKTTSIMDDIDIDGRKYCLTIEQAKPRLKDGFKKFTVEVKIESNKTTFTHRVNDTETTERIYAAQILNYMDEATPYCKKELANMLSSQLAKVITSEDSTLARTLTALMNSELGCMSAKHYKATFGVEPTHEDTKVWSTSLVYWLKGTPAEGSLFE